MQDSSYEFTCPTSGPPMHSDSPTTSFTCLSPVPSAGEREEELDEEDQHLRPRAPRPGPPGVSTRRRISFRQV